MGEPCGSVRPGRAGGPGPDTRPGRRQEVSATIMTNPMPMRLLTPGPTAVPPEVLAELGQPIIHHRTSDFRAIFAEVSERLQRVCRTSGPVLSIAGSGTTAFEAAQVSLLPEHGGRALTIAGGKFGERWQDIYDAYDVPQIRIDVPWGSAVDVARVEQALREHRDVSMVTLVASETSTATASDVRAVARVVSQTDALLLVDGITAVGALPTEMDEWGIDVLVTGSQKALMLPPGLGYVALGPRALARLEQARPRTCYNLDLRRWLKSHRDHDVPFTPPISLIRAQRVALAMIEQTGLERVWARTAALAAAVRAAFAAMGLDPVSTAPSDSVSGAFYPAGMDDGAFRKALRQRHGIHIAGGQKGRGANWSGRIFRVSHMGYVSADDTRAALGAIESELIEAGHAVKAGSAVEAARPHLAGAG